MGSLSPLKVSGSFQFKCEMVISWLRKRSYCKSQTKNVAEQAFLTVVPETMGKTLKITTEIHSCINCE